MEKFSWKKLKPYAIEAILFLLVVALGWFSGTFLLGGIQKKMDRLQELDVISDNRYRQMSGLPDLAKQYEFIQANEEKLSGILMNKDRLVEFIENLENIAKEQGIEIKISSQDNMLLESKVTPATPKKSVTSANDDSVVPAPDSGKKKLTGILADLPSPDFIRLTVTVTGTYPEVVAFLHSMETLPYTLDVVGVQLTEHIEDDATVPDTGVNPFNPDGTLAVPLISSSPSILRLDANYDTVVYIQK